jgi:hypothetical protein
MSENSAVYSVVRRDAWTTILSTIISSDSSKLKITNVEYEQFKKEYVMAALADKRYGQAFCERYEIDNSSPLYWFNDQKICARWIEERYIQDVE